MRIRSRHCCLLLLGLALAGCANDSEIGTLESEKKDSIASPRRNWRAAPAVIEVDGAKELFAFSDPHGGYEAMVHLLAVNGLVAAETNEPARLEWRGGASVLVVAGDLIDKGTRSIDVIDALRKLEADASRAGGRVIVTLGNHEAEFLSDPKNEKATREGANEEGVVWDLRARDIDPNTLARGTDPEGRGVWLSSLPFAARVGSWFFAHAGHAGERSVAELADDLEKAVDRGGFSSKEVLGGNSILEAQEWFGKHDEDDAGRADADALGVEHIAFGHDPGAFGHHGRIESSKNGVLVKLNVDMGLDLDDATKGGLLLHVDLTRGQADVRDATGRSSALEFVK